MYFTTQVSVHFNISLPVGKLPSIWKISCTTPVYKNKGSEQEVSNYRPISITSVICKILENIIFKYIRIYKHRYGFQPVDSTTKQLVLENGKDVGLIFCHISNVFDRFIEQIKLYIWYKQTSHKLGRR